MSQDYLNYKAWEERYKAGLPTIGAPAVIKQLSTRAGKVAVDGMVVTVTYFRKSCPMQFKMDWLKSQGYEIKERHLCGSRVGR